MRSIQTLIFMVMVFLISCTKDNFLPDLEGNLVGYVYTFNEFAELLPDHSGVLVSTRGNKKYKTTTDKYGRFEFKDLPVGTYELCFEKQGFGTLKFAGVKHLGGTPTIFGLRDQNRYITAFFIYQFPKTKILKMSIESDTLYATFDLKGYEPYWMTLDVYFSEKQGFSTDEAQQSISRGLRPGKGVYKSKLTQFNSPDLLKGKKVYFKARIKRFIGGVDIGNLDVYGISNYYDYSLKKTIYPNIGDASSEYSFIVPE